MQIIDEERADDNLLGNNLKSSTLDMQTNHEELNS